VADAVAALRSPATSFKRKASALTHRKLHLSLSADLPTADTSLLPVPKDLVRDRFEAVQTPGYGLSSAARAVADAVAALESSERKASAHKIFRYLELLIDDNSKLVAFAYESAKVL